MNQLCERCRTQQAEVIAAEMYVCGPCAAVLEWSYGIPREATQPEAVEPPAEVFTAEIVDMDGPPPIEGDYMTGGLGDVTLPGVIVPPVGVAQAFGVWPQSSRAKTPDAKQDGFPWLKVMIVVGGVAAVGAVGMILVRMVETAHETQREGREFIKQHPEVLTALV